MKTLARALAVLLLMTSGHTPAGAGNRSPAAESCPNDDTTPLAGIERLAASVSAADTYTHPRVSGKSRILNGSHEVDLLVCTEGSVRVAYPRAKGGCYPPAITPQFHKTLLPALYTCMRRHVPEAGDPGLPIRVVHWGISRDVAIPRKGSEDCPDGFIEMALTGHETNSAIDIHEIQVGTKRFNFQKAVEANRAAVEKYVLAAAEPSSSTIPSHDLYGLVAEFYEGYRAGNVAQRLEYIDFWSPLLSCLSKENALSYTTTMYERNVAGKDVIVPEFKPAQADKFGHPVSFQKVRAPSEMTVNHHDHVHVDYAGDEQYIKVQCRP